jgi:hypothetical protein
MEETMRVLTIQELMRLTRTELWGLASRINTKLPTFPEGSDRRLSSQHVPLFLCGRCRGLRPSSGAHQWVSVKRWQIVPTEDLPANEWNADTCEVAKLVLAEITARLDAMVQMTKRHGRDGVGNERRPQDSGGNRASLRPTKGGAAFGATGTGRRTFVWPPVREEGRGTGGGSRG